MSGAITVGVLDTKVCNRKKGIAETADLMRLTANKTNPDYVNAFKENPKQFRRKNGIFSHVYDSAARFGEDKPFKV